MNQIKISEDKILNSYQKNRLIPGFCLSVLLFIFLGDGGKSDPYWFLSVSFLSLLALFTYDKEKFLSVLAHPLASVFLGIGLLGIVSSLFSSCFLLGLKSLNKYFGAVLFGILVYSSGGNVYKKYFILILLALGLFQSVYLFIGKIFFKSTIWIISGNSQYSSFIVCLAALFSLNKFLDIIYLTSRAQLKKNQLYLWLLIAGVLFTTVFFLSSRSALLCYACAGLFLFWKKNGIKGITIAALFSSVWGAVFLFFGKWGDILKLTDPLSWKRTDIWYTTIKGIFEKPFLGWGPGMYETLYYKYTLPQSTDIVRFNHHTSFAHNEYLQIASMWGGPCLILLLLGIVFYMKHTSLQEDHIKAGLLATGIFSFFNFPFYAPIVCLILASLLAWTRSKPMKINWLFSYSFIFQKSVYPCLVILLAGNLLAFGQTLFSNAGKATILSQFDLKNELTTVDKMLHQSENAFPDLTKRAENRLKKIVNKCRNCAEAWYQLSHLNHKHLKPPQFESGINYLKRAIRYRPHHAPWLLELSSLYERNNQMEKALRYAKQAYELEPYYARAVLQIGRLFRTQKRPLEAENFLVQFKDNVVHKIDVNYKNVSNYKKNIIQINFDEIRREIVRCYIDQKKYDQAFVLLSDVSDKKNIDTLFLKATLFYLAEDFLAAKEILGKILILAPDNKQIRENYEILEKKLNIK